MAAQQAELELLRQLLGDRPGDETAEARVDAVRVLALAVDGSLDEVAGGPHPLAGRVGDLDRRVVDGDGPDVGETEVVAGESLALDHAASLSRALPPAGTATGSLSTVRPASSPRRS